MTNEKTAQGSLVTRRDILSGAAVGALACLLPGRLLGAMTKSGTAGLPAAIRRGTNLYAFRGAGTRDRLAIAVTFGEGLTPEGVSYGWRDPFVRAGLGGDRVISEVRLHVGTQEWAVKGLESLAKAVTWEEKGARIFAGKLSGGRAFGGAPLGAIVVEASMAMLVRAGSGGIWAELFTSDGERERIGSPFLARILAKNPSLAKVYDRTSPADDKVELMEQVAAAIAADARKRGTLADPDAHGRRLAEVLLPDVLRYDPDRPSGFTFAGQNGRHPQEATELVVDSILTGTLLPFPAHRAVALHDEFPYFAVAL